MGAKNMVIAGDYYGRQVANVMGEAALQGGGERVPLNKIYVERYDVITEETRKSAASGIVRGAVGSALLGPVGLLAGVSAKNKSVVTIAIRFKDGKNSLIEVDEKLYKLIVLACF